MEALDRIAIPRRVLDVLGEVRGHRHAEGPLVDRDVDAELGEDGVQTRVELGHGETFGEREPALVAAVCPHDELVRDQVEGDVERRLAAVERAGGQAADVDIERSMPPVVAWGRRREAHLPQDLRVQVQRVLRRPPAGDPQLGKRHRRGRLPHSGRLLVKWADIVQTATSQADWGADG